ncbi:CAP secretory protein [Perilla frutescens var. hirtella]|uniref:CAP secretory protein n=1 Tax=Perilla frutescens var. hirtella TaxID=608512 RepID=A0AAD4P706_PERFH|nr:CAP secretory protein [Perilla frutescens var. hirtella]
MKHTTLLLLITIITVQTTNHLSEARRRPWHPFIPAVAIPIPSNRSIHRISRHLCWNCAGDALQFLYGHNLVRARKMEMPLAWDPELANYAARWAGQRRGDCELMHSFPEGHFDLGENIYWGGGESWTPMDAVNAWADEEKFYDYDANSCAAGQSCGHYTQIVWRSTMKVGCARVVCDGGDVFMNCNYFPPGNYVGQRPY